MESTHHLEHAAMNESTGEDAVTPPTAPSATQPQEWRVVKVDAHRNRSRIFTRTRVIARYKSARLYAISSRRFGREWPPTKRTRPALRQRRHSVDVVTQAWTPDTAFSHILPHWSPEDEHVAVPWAPSYFAAVLCILSTARSDQ